MVAMATMFAGGMADTFDMMGASVAAYEERRRMMTRVFRACPAAVPQTDSRAQRVRRVALRGGMRCGQGRQQQCHPADLGEQVSVVSSCLKKACCIHIVEESR